MPRHKAIPSVYAILRKDDQVLLSRRFQTGYCDGMYSLPAGHAEEGESIIAAVQREAKEEIGVELGRDQVKLVHFRHRLRQNDGDRIDFFFVCDHWSGEPENREVEKCDELRWVSLNALPENTIPYIRECLLLIQQGVDYSEQDRE
jgi:8-oxo-dGTP diphosphatase